MESKIEDYLQGNNGDIIFVRPEATVHDAIKAMAEHKIGSVLVISEDEKLQGIFTERDVLNFCVHRIDEIKSTPVEEVMTKNLIIGLLDDNVGYLMGIMSSNKIRHLPILKDTKVAGVVSIGDLVKSQMKNIEYENRYLKDYIRGKYPG
jgi:CBS domain-containing protein